MRVARIGNTGHGGQILISETARALLGGRLPEGTTVVDLGPGSRLGLADKQGVRPIVEQVRARSLRAGLLHLAYPLPILPVPAVLRGNCSTFGALS